MIKLFGYLGLFFGIIYSFINVPSTEDIRVVNRYGIYMYTWSRRLPFNEIFFQSILYIFIGGVIGVIIGAVIGHFMDKRSSKKLDEWRRSNPNRSYKTYHSESDYSKLSTSRTYDNGNYVTVSERKHNARTHERLKEQGCPYCGSYPCTFSCSSGW